MRARPLGEGSPPHTSQTFCSEQSQQGRNRPLLTKLSAAPPREKSVNNNNYDFPALSSLFFRQEQWVGCPRRAAADCTLTYDDDDDVDGDDGDDHDDDHDIEGNDDENIINDDKKKIVPSGSAPPQTS